MTYPFQPGDAKRLRWIIHNYPFTLGEENIEMLKRFRSKAEELDQ